MSGEFLDGIVLHYVDASPPGALSPALLWFLGRLRAALFVQEEAIAGLACLGGVIRLTRGCRNTSHTKELLFGAISDAEPQVRRKTIPAVVSGKAAEEVHLITAARNLMKWPCVDGDAVI